MEKRRIVCLHPVINSVESFLDYFCLDNSKYKNLFVWEENSPEYVIVTEHLYKNAKIFKKFKEYFKKDENIIFIFHAGEAVFPDLNLFDYAIIMNRHMSVMDRVCRIPPELFFRNQIYKLELPVSNGPENNDKKFCNFIYSNAVAHPMRDRLFHSINQYKKVDSLGAHLNNTNMPSTRYDKNWALLSTELKSQYKFTIASENAEFEGYTSEKLLTSFCAHSVPIYWGDPTVDEEFNKDAFINCNQYRSMDDIIDRIREIDNDDDLWKKMISEPWKTPEQEKKLQKDTDDYYAFIDFIFLQDKSFAGRRPKGTFISMYTAWFFRTFNPPKHYFKQICNKIKKILKSIRKN